MRNLDPKYTRETILVDETKEYDPTNPPHYRGSNEETIDWMRRVFSPEEFRAHCLATAMKYADRAPFKGQEIDDLKKMRWYLMMAMGKDPRNERD